MQYIMSYCKDEFVIADVMVRLTLQPDPLADCCLPVHHGATLVFMSISKPLRLRGWLDQAHSQLVSKGLSGLAAGSEMSSVSLDRNGLYLQVCLSSF